MKAQEVLKKVQKMYRKKNFELDEEKQNIMEVNRETVSRHGDFDDFEETIRSENHFCTIEFAGRLIKIK